MTTDLARLQSELTDLAAWFRKRGMESNCAFMGIVANRLTLRGYADGLAQDELRTLRAIINGKLGKRIITPEQQTKMQNARKKDKKEK